MTTEETLESELAQSEKYTSIVARRMIVIVFCAHLCQLEAQITNFVDCSDVGRQAGNFGMLSRAEKLELVASEFSVEVARFEKCEREDTSNVEVSSPNNKDANANTEGQSAQSDRGESSIGSLGKSSASARPGKDLPLSTNALVNGEKSTAFSTEGHQMSGGYNGSRAETVSNGEIQSQLEAEPGSGGKVHEQLETTDNLRILKEQIKAQADIETDPAVRSELLKRYEEL